MIRRDGGNHGKRSRGCVEAEINYGKILSALLIEPVAQRQSATLWIK